MTESPTAIRTPDATTTESVPARPTLAVWKFASCDGCQLTLLNCEDELLAVAERVQVAYFPEATRAVVAGPYDISLVEGSITTPGDAERIQQVRAASRTLVTIGACATAGGIQALRNFADVGEFLSVVYAHPAYLATLDRSTPISAHVTVDFQLRGCPIDKNQLLEVLAATLQGRRPRVPTSSVCVECKRRGVVCVAVADGMPCLGPVTQAGCGALCPSYHRGCYGCFGPHDTPNTASLAERLRAHGMPEVDVMRFFRTFNAGSEPFRAQSLASAAARSVDCADESDGRNVGIVSTILRRDPRGGGTVTHKLTSGSHVLSVETLARVEGEGGMHVHVQDGEVLDVHLRIFEPPRFFEAFLRGRAYTEPPDITARICGICPVAYQFSACLAIEDACGVVVPDEIRLLRRLLYCGEWIESHALHIFFLHAPDLLGYDGAIEMARDHRGLVESALRMKRAGNELMTVVGGRSVHPVNVRVGGFHRLPRRDELLAIRPALAAAREEAIAAVPIVSGFDFPEFEQPYLYLSLDSSNGYPLESGSLVTSAGLTAPVSEFGAHVVEAHVAHSNALHAAFDGQPYVVGPLARYSLNSAALSPLAREAAEVGGLGPTCRNPFKSIIVRTVELIHALDEAIAIIDGWQGAPVAAVEVPARAGEGHGATEAPRGLLYHRYRFDEAGTILDAQIVPPTSQNQPAIEADLRAFVQANLHLSHEELTRQCEVAIRTYDPCISCATHFLDLTVEHI